MRKFVPAFALTAALLGIGVATFPESGARAALPEEWKVSVEGHTQAGAQVEIYASGIDSGECDHIGFGWAPDHGDAMVPPDLEGFAHASLDVPDRPAGETVTLLMDCVLGDKVTPGPSTAVKIERPPAVTLSPTLGHPGSKVTVSGARFYCQEDSEGGAGGMAGPAATGPAELYWTGRPDARTEVPVTVGATFKTSVVVPKLPLGPQQLVVECAHSLGEDTATFMVTAAPPPESVVTPPASTAPRLRAPRAARPVAPPAAPPVPTASPTPAAPAATTPAVDPPVPDPDPTTAAALPAPSPGRPAVPAIERSELVPTAFDLPGSALEWVLTALIAALLILLIAFPAEVFNKTYEKNQHEIRGTARRLRLPELRLKPAAGFALFTAFSVALALVFAADEGAEGKPGNRIAQLVGLAAAIPVVMLVYAVPAERYLRRRTGLAAALRVLPTALLIAVACALLSALLDLNPPYLYGLFAGFAVAARAPRKGKEARSKAEGRAILRGFLSLAAVGGTAWLLWSPVHPAAVAPDAGWTPVILDSVLFWILVLSAEAMVFALIPLEFLDGARLRRWRFTAWLYPQVAAALFFTLVLVKRGDLNPPKEDMAAVFQAVAFFLIFGVASLLFRGYFRWPNRPTRGYAETRPGL